ncbi:hypothetical protein [Ferrimonas balearica]|uniref:hypothetical protein n=1 Tax=Ferrimonas balearica TaxID=44012 RepID=UPI001C567952|nr:hypothetical protein [Ferrimonas balearica]MBW3164416.1 hypothetical protein [Ferrimonas balearica]
MRALRSAVITATMMSLAACTSAPPKAYVAPTISTAVSAPGNADLSAANATFQRALNARHLYLTVDGDVAPYPDSSCRNGLLKRVSSPAEIGAAQDPLYAGYLLPVRLQASGVRYRDSMGQWQPLTSLPATAMTVYLDLSDDARTPLAAPTLSALSGQPVSLVLSDAQYQQWQKAGSGLGQGRIWVKRAPSLRRPEPEGANIEHLFQAHSGAVLQALDGNPLAACQSQQDSVFIASATVPFQPGRGYRLEELVAMLPQDADFNQLFRQAALVAKGRYLTYWGKLAVLQDRCKSGELGADVCGKGRATSQRDDQGLIVVIGGESSDD